MRAKKGGPVHWLAECQDCGWTNGARNAVGTASIHAEAHGHTVLVEVGYFWLYEGPKK